MCRRMTAAKMFSVLNALYRELSDVLVLQIAHYKKYLCEVGE